jgi:hypothetical protein
MTLTQVEIINEVWISIRFSKVLEKISKLVPKKVFGIMK